MELLISKGFSWLPGLGLRPFWEVEVLGAFLFLYLDIGGSQPSMGLTTRFSVKPSEYRELSWKAKLNPCSSLLMICTVSRASRPEEETSALRSSLDLGGSSHLPAPAVSQQILLDRQEEVFFQEILQLLFFPLPSSSAFDYLFLPFALQVTFLP